MHGHRDERGFTLIELMISIVILGIIIVPLTGAMITGLQTTTDAQKRLSSSRSPIFTSAYFADDAQSSDTVTTTGSPACGSGTNVVSFRWTEGLSTQYSSSYVLVGSGPQRVLKRSYCNASGTHTIVVAPILGANAACGQPACATVTNDATGHPRVVTLNATTCDASVSKCDAVKDFTLSATRRAT